MHGIHDLGGAHGHGPIQREDAEPAFHARWEAAVFAMVMAAAGRGLTGNADRFRHAIERIDPVAYLSHGYYGRWLGGLETLLVEAGVVSRDAITAGAVARGAPAQARIASRPAARGDAVDAATDPTCRRELAAAPRFAVGEHIRARLDTPAGHTRLAGYVRGCRGTIHACRGGWVFPDSHAHGRGEQACHLYTVAFSGEALWGSAAEPGCVIHIDLFEPYLDSDHD